MADTQNSDNLPSAEHQAEYTNAWDVLVSVDELDKKINLWEATNAPTIGELKEKEQKIAVLKAERDLLMAKVFPAASLQSATQPQATTPYPAPLRAVGAFDDLEVGVVKRQPVEQGLSTKDIAQAFDGVNGWDCERWSKNLSASNWLHSARIAIGQAGGAPSMWNPMLMAQLLHARIKNKREKEKLMKVFYSRFTKNPALRPWHDEFREYFETHWATE
ncbi:hypothetical protein [Polaromonas sp. CG9_12]|nr:hypothetical protein [Polaromonas sp. CG9_12]